MERRLSHIAGLASLGPRAPGSRAVNVVVETPAGSRYKFKLDEQSGVFSLHKVLPVGASFPFDFGFVPGTRAEDGDPLDVMLLGDEFAPLRRRGPQAAERRLANAVRARHQP